MRTTEKRLISQCEAIHSLCLDLGILVEGEKTHLALGSKINGRAFRLAKIEPDNHGWYRHPLGDYLGMTKSEASAALGHILDTLYAVDDIERTKANRADALVQES